MSKSVNTTTGEIRPLSTGELDAVSGAVDGLRISLKSLGMEIWASPNGYGVEITPDGGKTFIAHFHHT